MDTDTREVQPGWILGGALLLAGLLMTFATDSFRATASWVTLFSPVAFGAACVVFAVGSRRTRSVTARQPVGTGALILLGVWTPVAAVVQLVQTGAGASIDALSGFSITGSVVSFALALVTTVAIRRSRVVPPPWSWAPAWCLAAITAVRVFDTMLTAVPGSDVTAAAPLLTFLSALCSGGSSLGLGVLAIVLGMLPSAAIRSSNAGKT